MENAFHHDFSAVRIHDDTQASEASRELNAQAFTWGQDIYFGAGRYQPDTKEGYSLLGHELTHIVQQNIGHSTTSDQQLFNNRISDALEIEANQAAETISRSGSFTQALSPVCIGIQLFPDTVSPTSTESTTATTGPSGRENPSPAASTARTTKASSSPVLWGIDTSTKNTYLSVTIPGHTLTEVATYLYGSPDFAAKLRATNGDLPDRLLPGRTLRPTGDRLTEEANRNLNAALSEGIALRTEGIPSESGTRLMGYRFSAAGQSFELTEGQFNGLLQGLAVYLIRKAADLHRRALSGKQTQRDHVEKTNVLRGVISGKSGEPSGIGIVREISDLFAGQNLPPEIIWDVPELGAQHIIDSLNGAKLSADLITRQTKALYIVAQSLDDSFRTWNRYVKETILGAENAAELIRDTTLALAAAVAGALVAPLIIGAGGVTFLSGTLAIGAGAGTGALTRGVLEVAVPDVRGERSAGERFLSGLWKGAVEGGIGAASGIFARGLTSAISKRLFGVAPETLTSFGARAAVNVLTGVAIGVPSGMVDAAITSLPDLASGKISISEYLSRIGWAAFFGGLIGGVFALLHTALTGPKPTTALDRPEPTELVPPTSPQSVWEYTPEEVDISTGEVTKFARHSPTGKIFKLQFDPTTGNGSLTPVPPTGEVVNIRGGQVLPKPAGLLPAGPTETPPAPAGRTSARPLAGESPVTIEGPPAIEPLEGDRPMLEARRTPPSEAGSLAEEEIVWVNTTSRAKVYHRGGVRTKNGYWATKTQAEIAGYRAAKGNLEAARHGVAEHAMIAKALKRWVLNEGQLLAEGWKLEGVEMDVGKGRVDELYVNDTRNLVFVADTYTGPIESLEHFMKGWKYATAPRIMDYIKRGYRYDYRAAIKYPPMLH